MKPALPFHIYKIGLFTGHMYFVGAIIAHVYNYPNLVIICSAIYGTTMAHWYDIKTTGIAKTVDMVAVVAGILFISFHESYKFVGNGRKIWNSAILISAVSYLFNSTIFNFQNEPHNYFQNEPLVETPYNYFSLQPIPKNSPNVEKMNLYSTIVHAFFLHVMPISVGAYCVIKT